MSEKKSNAVTGYFVESVMELRRVTWPTGNKAFRLTALVLGFCIAAGAFIAVVDLLLNLGYTQLIELAGKI